MNHIKKNGSMKTKPKWAKLLPTDGNYLKRKTKSKILLLESCQVVWSTAIKKEAKLNRNQLACNK